MLIKVSANHETADPGSVFLAWTCREYAGHLALNQISHERFIADLPDGVDHRHAETLDAARQIAIDQGLCNVYVYKDQGCDCAQENLPVEDYLGNPERFYQEKKCAKLCCGEEGVRLKKFEKKTVEDPVLVPHALA